MRGIKKRLKKLEGKVEFVKLLKGDIAPWAFKYAEETIETAEKSLESRLRQAYEAGKIPVPLKFTIPESEIRRRAKYYTETYPSLQACTEGENQKRKKMRAEMMPGLKALKDAIKIEQERRKEL